MTRHVDAAETDSVRPLAPQEFEQFRQLAYRTFGLDLKSGKEELVSARLRKLVRGGGFHSFQDYYRSIVQDRTGESLLAMIDALATNHTVLSPRARSLPIPARSGTPGAGHTRPRRDLDRGMFHRRGGVDPGHGPQRSIGRSGGSASPPATFRTRRCALRSAPCTPRNAVMASPPPGSPAIFPPKDGRR